MHEFREVPHHQTYMPYHEHEHEIKHALEREKHQIDSHHDVEHETFESAQKYTEHSMSKRHEMEHQELERQHKIEWELK